MDLILPDMSCGHCVQVVTRTVQQLDPGAKLVFDLPSHKVHIDSSLAAEPLLAALAEQGYPAAA